MIAFLAVKLGLSLREIGALTLPQTQILIEEYARLSGALLEVSKPQASVMTDSPGGEILLDSLYEAVKARMGGPP